MSMLVGKVIKEKTTGYLFDVIHVEAIQSYDCHECFCALLVRHASSDKTLVAEWGIEERFELTDL